VDFLFASRPVARQLLAAAVEFKTAFGDLRVISTQGLIGFKARWKSTSGCSIANPCSRRFSMRRNNYDVTRC
jgi:hypothetical protein